MKRAIPVYTRGNRATFDPPPTGNPAARVLTARPWRIEGDQAVIVCRGKARRFNADELLAAATWRLFRLRVHTGRTKPCDSTNWPRKSARCATPKSGGSRGTSPRKCSTPASASSARSTGS